MPFLDPDLFSDDAIDDATRAQNAALIAAALAAPDRWSKTPEEMRQERRQGLGPFALQQPSPWAEWLDVPAGPAGGPGVRLRIIRPSGPARGAFLHLHGGGWMLGGADMQDERLEQTAERTGLAAVSVEYRLAPEHAFPAALDDCEAAALWLAESAAGRFGVERLFIGGESAGAHLAVLTLLRLRRRYNLSPFAGASLVCGIYDLGLTPSMRAFETPLVLSRRDVEAFVARLLQNGEDVRDPAVSPLYADLAGLPPALFSCGTRDGLIDDTFFMAARWAAAGGSAELSLWPGGPHAFQGIDMALAIASNAAIDDWLVRRLDVP
jgi:acetyl esterase